MMVVAAQACGVLVKYGQTAKLVVVVVVMLLMVAAACEEEKIVDCGYLGMQKESTCEWWRRDTASPKE